MLSWRIEWILDAYITWISLGNILTKRNNLLQLVIWTDMQLLIVEVGYIKYQMREVVLNIHAAADT